MSTAGLRDDLKALRATGTTHAGLWLERYLPALEKAGEKQTHIDGLIQSIDPPRAYRLFYERWKDSLQRVGPCTLLAEAEVVGRMAVGLGSESILETSVTLHRTYGVPYIPGSALKGLAAAAAHNHLAHPSWRKAGKGEDQPAGESHRLMFGDHESSGYVTFHDAIWIPHGNRLPLRLDVMTVHHANYYQKGKEPPAEWDDPNPVAFASAHGRYLIAVTGPKEWAEAAMKILAEALAQDGIGAKTAAGYGRMILTSIDPSRQQQLNGGSPPWENLIKDLHFGTAGHIVPDLLGKLSGDERRAAALRIIERLERRALRHKDRRDKDWVKLLFQAAGEGNG